MDVDVDVASFEHAEASKACAGPREVAASGNAGAFSAHASVPSAAESLQLTRSVPCIEPLPIVVLSRPREVTCQRGLRAARGKSANTQNSRWSSSQACDTRQPARSASAPNLSRSYFLELSVWMVSPSRKWNRH